MQLDPSAFVADPALIEELSSHAEPFDCTHERALFHQGDAATGVYLLLEGSAIIAMMDESGKNLIHSKAAVRSILGLPGLIGNLPYTLSVTAEAGAQVRFVSRETFTALMQSDPKIAMRVLKVLAAEVRAARQAMGHI